MNELSKLARSEILSMQAYVSARSEKNRVAINLDANENPFDHSEQGFNCYPEPQPPLLLSRLAKYYQVSEEELLVVRGIDEGIDVLVRVFCRPYRDAIMIFPPTYGMYEVAAHIQGVEVIQVPLIVEENFSLDANKATQKWQPNLKLFFFCSPNNPTGNALEQSAILALARKFKDYALIIVDEAYIEFSQTSSFIPYLKTYPNLVVLRTFSKAHGLAGLRCGCVIANPEIIRVLKKILAPYPLPTPVIHHLSEYLVSPELVALPRQIALLNAERECLRQRLMTLPFVNKVWPSQANFILLSVVNAKSLILYCLQKNILIRDRSQLGLGDCVRISLGSPDQNRYLWEVLQNVAEEIFVY